MALNKNTYGLPDPTLQLIGSAPELNFGAAPQGGMTSIISALRGERSSNNPGVTLLANKANGNGITFNRKPTAASSFVPILKMPKVIAPDVTLPTADTSTPYVKPDVPKVPDVPYVPVIDDPDVVDPDPVDPDPVDPDPVDPDPVDPDPVDPDPDWVDPTELDPFVLDPLVYPEDPVKERDGTVTIEPVDPNEDTPQDDGTTQDILDLINSGLVPGPQEDVIQDDGTTGDIQDLIDYLNSSFGGGGGGKAMFDETAANMAF